MADFGVFFAPLRRILAKKVTDSKQNLRTP